MTQAQAIERKGATQPLLVVIGVLWLLLAAAVIISQLANPTPIRIEWKTETEIDTAGFNVYRKECPRRSANCEFILLNDTLIPSAGDSVTGASYSFTDRNVAAGATYTYQLEDVELDNSREQHEPIVYSTPLIAWWVPVVASVGILVCLLLIIKGLSIR